MKYEYSQPNNCIYYEHGCCTRPSLKFYECPATMRWNDDNSNNLLCDFAGYEPKENIEEKLEKNDQSNKWIVTYAGYNAPDGYPEYKYVCPYCGGGNGGKYCRDCGRMIKGRIPDETVADDFKEIFIDLKEN